MAYAVKWGLWRQSGGESGEEPPEDWKKQWERMEKWYAATTEEEYQKLAKEIWGFFSEKLVCIGTVRFPPSPVVVKNDLRNVPEEAYYGEGMNWEKSLFPLQWFFK
jgi:peptide/nickel transport system substrate-binding protein